ncbi:hypothetical protein [Cellvibrio sp.]|uniref:hypothetical protein n=1 Tax=Cellvibrio sp. TaxID=1965322 RepID=UPI0039648046
MKKKYPIKFFVAANIVAVQVAYAADEKPFNVNLSAQGIWDSNFSRSPLNDSEQGLLSSAGFRFDDKIGRQRLIAKWDIHRYEYNDHPDFDATTDAGQLSWKGAFGSKVTADIDFLRNSYQVDRLEFFGKDIVTRDDLSARFGYGTESRLSFHAGARKSEQEHSNEGRRALDFDEKEGFADIGFQTNNKSTLFLRYKSGERTYSHWVSDTLDTAFADLDFDYRQLELEAQWALSSKTTLSALVARFERDGAINDARGSVVNIGVDWRVTEKAWLKAGYTLAEPALGETSDSASRIKTFSLSAQWQFLSKWGLGSAVAYSVVDYEHLPPEFVRQETAYTVSPVTLTFDSGHHWRLRLDSGWRKNESPIFVRDYIARQINAGIFFYY